MKIEDKNEQDSFHPSLDIKNGISVLGFKVKKEKDKEENVYIVTSDEGVQLVQESGFSHKDKYYPIEIKNRKLNKLSRKWGAERVNSFFESLNESVGSKFDGKELYVKLKENLHKYVVLENEADYTILTAWIMGTYVFPIFSAYPYIHVKAPKQSGKSQCLNFLKETAFNAVKARATFAALRDTVDSLRGTYLIDQADGLAKNYMGDFLDMLTDSYKKAGGEIRKNVKVGDGWELQEFEAYCPKGFASIEELPEDLRDRCIVIPLIRSKDNVPPIDEDDYVWKDLRSSLYMLPIQEHIFIGGNYTWKLHEYKKSNEIIGRQLELWIPIETILITFGIDVGEIEKAKKRFQSHYEFAGYQTSNLELAIIETIMKMIGTETEVTLRPKEIAEAVNSEAFEEEQSDWIMSPKQKAVKVGKAIGKFNLASQKLKRDSYGEKYLFVSEHLKKIYDGYFNNHETDTPSYTGGKEIETQELFSDGESVGA